VAEAAPEVAGRLEWGGVKSHEAGPSGCRRFSATSWPHLADRPHGPTALVFTAPQGGPLHESRWVARLPQAGRPGGRLPQRLSWYDPRHTCASLLIREGASVKAVQKQLGHATARITLDTMGTCSRTSWTPWAAWRTSTNGRWRRGPPTCGPAAVPPREGRGQ
jgi:hypothetical protein